MDILWAGRLRPQILACARAKVTLHDHLQGLEVCKQIEQDLRNALKMGATPAGDAAAAMGATGGTTGGLASGGLAPGDASGGAGTLHTGGDDQIDPAKLAAETRTEQALTKLHFHLDIDIGFDSASTTRR